MKIDKEKLKNSIIKALFIDKKHIVTEVTFKYHTSKYAVGYTTNFDIKQAVLEINKSNLYPKIDIYLNKYNVLTLTFH